jgi:hypothetical protein
MVAGALLLKDGIIDRVQYDLLSRSRALLNEAEQAPPDSISVESAERFVELDQRLATALQGYVSSKVGQAAPATTAFMASVVIYFQQLRCSECGELHRSPLAAPTSARSRKIYSFPFLAVN